MTAGLATASRSSADAPTARAPVRLPAAGRYAAPAAADGVLRRCACGGSCPRCRGDALRPKLAINTPGDAFEREADAAAEAVMSGAAAGSASPAPPLLRRCACGGSCPSCRKEKEEKEEELHREDAGGGGVGFAPPVVHDVLASPGRPLAAPARALMETRFGADFSGVRVHDDARAAQSARAVDAHAYAVGSDLVFGAGRYAPGTAGGDRLLAHELAHTLQDGGTLVRRQPVDDPELPADLPRAGPPRTLPGQPGVPPMPAVNPINEPAEPGCPNPPTRIGNLTPVPPCNEDGEDIEGGTPFTFCTDSDVLNPGTQRQAIRDFAARQRSGSTFRVRAYASREGPGATQADRDAYNLRLSCHRAKRVVRELINAGVPETSIDAAAKGPTEQFGPGMAGRPANRTAVVDAAPPTGASSRPASAALMSAAQIRDAARQALVDGDYRLGADAYFARWTCGRYRALADAVDRTNVQMEGADFPGPIDEQGNIAAVGLNTIKLSSSVRDATDPIGCAMTRIADLTFHHFARPQLPAFSDQHRAGMHLVHLAGLPACVVNLDPLGATQRTISTPVATDPFAGQAPACADRPLQGPMTPGRGPATQDVPPTFTLDPIRVGTSSGSVGPGSSNALTVGADPDNPFDLAADVTAAGNAAAIRDHEIGFIQTVMAERWENTHVDGRRERRRFPLPLRDGPPSGDPLSDPPWFARFARAAAVTGANTVSMTDAPNFRAFRALPDPAQSSFFRSLTIQPPGTAAPARHDIATPTFAATHPGNAPDRGMRILRFNTWVAVRRRGAPATLQDTQFLGGLMLRYRLDADWRPTASGSFAAAGSWSLTTRDATPDESQQLMLRGATGLDFVSPLTGAPLFNELLSIDPALPIAQAGGQSLHPYIAAVRAIVDPLRTTPRLRGEFMVRLRVQAETGRLILDPPVTGGGAVRVEPADGGPAIAAAEALALARAIFPEVRKLVAGQMTGNQPTSGVFTLPVRIQPLP